jgi:hypothetical protein
MPLCLGVRGPGIAELCSVAGRESCSVVKPNNLNPRVQYSFRLFERAMGRAPVGIGSAFGNNNPCALVPWQRGMLATAPFIECYALHVGCNTQ